MSAVANASAFEIVLSHNFSNVSLSHFLRQDRRRDNVSTQCRYLSTGIERRRPEIGHPHGTVYRYSRQSGAATCLDERNRLGFRRSINTTAVRYGRFDDLSSVLARKGAKRAGDSQSSPNVSNITNDKVPGLNHARYQSKPTIPKFAPNPNGLRPQEFWKTFLPKHIPRLVKRALKDRHDRRSALSLDDICAYLHSIYDLKSLGQNEWEDRVLKELGTSATYGRVENQSGSGQLYFLKPPAPTPAESSSEIVSSMVRPGHTTPSSTSARLPSAEPIIQEPEPGHETRQSHAPVQPIFIAVRKQHFAQLRPRDVTGVYAHYVEWLNCHATRLVVQHNELADGNSRIITPKVKDRYRLQRYAARFEAFDLTMRMLGTKEQQAAVVDRAKAQGLRDYWAAYELDVLQPLQDCARAVAKYYGSFGNTPKVPAESRARHYIRTYLFQEFQRNVSKVQRKLDQMDGSIREFHLEIASINEAGQQWQAQLYEDAQNLLDRIESFKSSKNGEESVTVRQRRFTAQVELARKGLVVAYTTWLDCLVRIGRVSQKDADSSIRKYSLVTGRDFDVLGSALHEWRAQRLAAILELGAPETYVKAKLKKMHLIQDMWAVWGDSLTDRKVDLGVMFEMNHYWMLDREERNAREERRRKRRAAPVRHQAIASKMQDLSMGAKEVKRLIDIVYLDGLSFPRTPMQVYLTSTVGHVVFYRYRWYIRDLRMELSDICRTCADGTLFDHLRLDSAQRQHYEEWKVLASRMVNHWKERERELNEQWREFIHAIDTYRIWAGAQYLVADYLKLAPPSGPPSETSKTLYGHEMTAIGYTHSEIQPYTVRSLQLMQWPQHQDLYPRQRGVPIEFVHSRAGLQSAIHSLGQPDILGIYAFLQTTPDALRLTYPWLDTLVLATRDKVVIFAARTTKMSGMVYTDFSPALQRLLSDTSVVKVGVDMSLLRAVMLREFKIEMERTVDLVVVPTGGASEAEAPKNAIVNHGGWGAEVATSLTSTDKNLLRVRVANRGISIPEWPKDDDLSGRVEHLASCAYAVVKMYADSQGGADESRVAGQLLSTNRTEDSDRTFGPVLIDRSANGMEKVRRLPKSSLVPSVFPRATSDDISRALARSMAHRTIHFKQKSQLNMGSLMLYYLVTSLGKSLPEAARLMGVRQVATPVMRIASSFDLPIHSWHYDRILGPAQQREYETSLSAPERRNRRGSAVVREAMKSKEKSRNDKDGTAAQSLRSSSRIRASASVRTGTKSTARKLRHTSKEEEAVRVAIRKRRRPRNTTRAVRTDEPRTKVTNSTSSLPDMSPVAATKTPPQEKVRSSSESPPSQTKPSETISKTLLEETPPSISVSERRSKRKKAAKAKDSSKTADPYEGIDD